MANVTFSKKRVFELLGQDLTDDQLANRSNMMGVEVEDLQGDALSLEITANRPDRLSEEGYARSLKKFLEISPGLSTYEVKSSDYVAHVDPSTKAVREHAVCAVVKNVPMDAHLFEQIIQLQEKLHGTLARKRKSAAIGVHDLSQIAFPITYTTVDEKFSFIPLDGTGKMSITDILEKHQKGKDYAHLVPGPIYPVWLDANKEVVAFPPIINGNKTAINETTRDLFIDVTGPNRKTVEQCLAIIVTSLAETGAEIYSVRVDSHVMPNLSPRTIEVDATYVNKLIGLNLTQNEIEACLEKLGHAVKVLDRSKMLVSIASYRTDVLHPMDIVEDVAIGYGYENLKPEIPNVATIGEEDIGAIKTRKIVDVLVGLGFQELNTNHLMSEKDLEKMSVEAKGLVRAVNAVNIEYNVLRPLLLPVQLKILQENTHHDYPQKIAEVGKVIVHDANEETQVREMLHVALCIAHPKVDYSEIRATIEALLHGLGVSYELKASTHPFFLEGRTADVLVNGKQVGAIGEVNPEVLANFAIDMPTVALELDVELLFQ